LLALGPAPGHLRAKAAVILRLIEQQHPDLPAPESLPDNDRQPRPNAQQLYAQLLTAHDPKHSTWASQAWLEKLPDFEWPKLFRDTLVELAKAQK
jgi:hypothetical protein